uniref:Uncharacterized protein n=1 Tax=Kwoniella bestiolae CBS 10118 TaxID=1296100 RepID=A0A1B9FW36_9TREE|nr:hypothetical protein I302_07328 [Kwoniella bestiolae CBS 10118]OCF22978.1 hypothetical protein I302_07328 [Kwoniella bestiolae CBS 10118]
MDEDPLTYGELFGQHIEYLGSFNGNGLVIVRVHRFLKTEYDGLQWEIGLCKPITPCIGDVFEDAAGSDKSVSQMPRRSLNSTGRPIAPQPVTLVTIDHELFKGAQSVKKGNEEDPIGNESILVLRACDDHSKSAVRQMKPHQIQLNLSKHTERV